MIKTPQECDSEYNIQTTVLTLTEMPPRGSVMNSGNASRTSWALWLMWIFRAETLARSPFNVLPYLGAVAPWLACLWSCEIFRLG